MRFHRKNCMNCHFCSKRTRQGDGQEWNFSLSKDERENCRNGSYFFLQKPTYWLVCAADQWQEGLRGAPEREHLTKKKCRQFLYWKSARGMTFEAAKTEIAHQHEDKKNRWVKLGILATVVSAVVAVFMLG